MWNEKKISRIFSLILHACDITTDHIISAIEYNENLSKLAVGVDSVEKKYSLLLTSETDL